MTLDMKSSLIVIMVLSLALVGSISNSYALTGNFVTSFDGSGGNGVTFINPVAHVVDSNDRIITLDSFLKRIQIYNPDGSFITSFDGSGGGGTKFVNLAALTVNSEDRIIVYDSILDIIQIFDSNGNFISSFDGTNGGNAFTNVSSLAVGPNNRIITYDLFLNTIQIYNPDGSFDISFDGSDGDGVKFKNVTRLAVDSNNRIITVDASLLIVQIYNPDGSFDISFDGSDGGDKFLLPISLAVDSTDRIFVFDVFANTIQIYNPDGSFVSSFGINTTSLTVLNSLAVDSNGRITVFDSTNDLIHIYNPDGSFNSNFNGSESDSVAFIDVDAIAVDSNNRIITLDKILEAIQIYDSEGKFVFSFNGSEGDGLQFNNLNAIAVDNNNRIIAYDNSLDTIQIYDSTGLFVSSFDGSDGDGKKFDNVYKIAVDSNNRIITLDNFSNRIQIFNPDGSFVSKFLGGSGGVPPNGAITVDNNNRIIVYDSILSTIQIYNADESVNSDFVGPDGDSITFTKVTGLAVDSEDRLIILDGDQQLVQIYDSTGSFITSFDGSGGNGVKFTNIISVAVDSNDRIITLDGDRQLVQIYSYESITSESTDDQKSKRGGGSCADCTPPTLGMNLQYNRVVDNGFSYNGNSVQVEKWYTPFPLINATVGETNTVEIIVYENQGISNMKVVQFGLGVTEIGQPINNVEVLIEVWLETFGTNTDIAVEKIIINDKDNLIENSTVVAVVDVVKCTTDSQNEACIKVTLQYSYREPTINNVMLVNVRDKPRNAQNFYFNEGIQVIGESMNPTPFVILNNKKTSQQTEDLTLTLFRMDKIKDIWIDGKGIEYHRINDNLFDRITPAEPYKCTDTPLDEIKVPTRMNCNFNNAVYYENIRAVQHFDSSQIQKTLGGTIESVSVNVIPREKILEILEDELNAEEIKAKEIMVDILDPTMKYRDAN